MYLCGSQYYEFLRNSILGTYTQICQNKIKIWLKSGKNVRHFTWRPKYVSLLSATLNRHNSALSLRVLIGLLVQPNRYKHYSNAPRVTSYVHCSFCLRWRELLLLKSNILLVTSNYRQLGLLTPGFLQFTAFTSRSRNNIHISCT